MSFLEKMTTKFNQKKYCKLRTRKNEPLSNISQKQPWVTKEVVETTVSTPIASDPKAAFPAVFIEGITPCPKKARGSDKGKSKMDSNVWDNVATVMGRAHNIVTLDELKGLSIVPSHELVSHHVHKLVQIRPLPELALISVFFISQNSFYFIFFIYL